MDLKAIMTGTSKPDQLNQNLINQPKIDTSERSVGFWRAFSLDVFSVLLAAAFGASYYWYITQGVSVWVLFAALILFAVTSVIQVFLAKNNMRRFAVIFLETIAALGFFWQDDMRILGITGIIMIVMLLWGYLIARSHLKNSIEIPFFTTSGKVLAKFTTGVLLFMLLIYVPQIGNNALLVSQQSFRNFFDWTSGFVTGFYPQLSLNGTFGNFAQSFAKMELQNNPNFQSLNTAQQNAAVQQEANQFSQSFSRSSAVPVASSSPASDAFYNVLNGVLGAWQSQSSGWFDVGWVAVVFIGLRALGILFVWLAEFISLIFYEILLASGFMKVTEESHTREIIGY